MLKNIIAYILLIVIVGSMIFAGYGGIKLAGQLADKRKVFVSDRINLCEKAGGKYRLYYSKYEQNYYESCDTLSKEIKLK